MNVNVSRAVIAGTVVLLVIAGATRGDGGPDMLLERERYDETITQALRVALAKARELGYEVEKMQVTVSVRDVKATAYFETIPEPGHAILGGDLTVVVDVKTLAVVDVQRGQ